MSLSKASADVLAEKLATWSAAVLDEIRSGASAEDLRQMVADCDHAVSKTRGELLRREAAEREDQWKEDKELLSKIMDWSSRLPKGVRFDATFVRRMLDLGKPLSDGQRQAVENVCEKWNIPV